MLTEHLERRPVSAGCSVVSCCPRSQLRKVGHPGGSHSPEALWPSSRPDSGLAPRHGHPCPSPRSFGTFSGSHTWRQPGPQSHARWTHLGPHSPGDMSGFGPNPQTSHSVG